jgi:hypothetical protein
MSKETTAEPGGDQYAERGRDKANRPLREEPQGPSSEDIIEAGERGTNDNLRGIPANNNPPEQLSNKGNLGKKGSMSDSFDDDRGYYTMDEDERK